MDAREVTSPGMQHDYGAASPMKIPSNLPTNKKLSLKFDTLLWLIASALTVYYADIVNVIMTHSLTNRIPFLFAIFFGGLAVAVAVYLIVWCSYVKRVSTDDWEAYNPYAIPAATGCGVMSGLCWNIALWEVYGIKTPLITLILCMGMVMVISLLPSWSSAEKSSSKPSLNNSKWLSTHGKID